MAVSAQAPTLLPLDESGKPLRRALIWMDRRADEEVERLNQQFGAERIYEITGNRTDSFYIAAKLLWMCNHEPELLARTRQFVQINGYIAYRLTGMFSLDPVHAALLQLRDYHAGSWAKALYEACGVSPDQFPPILPGHSILGEVTTQAAKTTGLRPGTPVMVGTVDGSAAALEAGAVEAGIAAEMTGTSTVVLMPHDSAVTDPALIAMPHAVPGLHLLLGATVSSGASLRWFRDQFAADEVRQAKQTGADAFDLLTKQAAGIAAGCGGVMFLPYMMGERSPLWHSQARGVFFGLSLATPRAALVRAILEGTSFALRHNVEVAQAAGMRVDEIRSVGGGARSALWCQIKADVLGIPVVLPEAQVGAPFGDALLVGLGLGLFPDLRSAARDLIRVQRRYEPDPARHALYTEMYGLFRDLYLHLRDDFDRAAALFTRGNT
jgi:xylulokinase